MVSMMETLDGGLFDPIATSAGFMLAPVDEVLDALVTWQRGISSVESVSVDRVRDAFPYALAGLDPLVRGGRDKYPLCDVGNGWTAYFDNGALGSDPDSAVGHLTRAHLWQGVLLDCTPTYPSRNGGVQFTLLSPLRTDWLNYVRTVSLTEDGGRWSFNLSGTPQPFEDLEQYNARRKVDRFTPEMLREYCEALGFDPFDWTHYELTYLISTELNWTPTHISLTERRAQLGIATAEPTDH